MIAEPYSKLVCVLFFAAVPVVAQSEGYWLINEIKGTWQYRTGDGEARPLVGSYECLRPNMEVRCTDRDVRQCELRYLVSHSSVDTERLPIRLPRSGVWVSLKNLKPPSESVLSPTIKDLISKFERITQKGGSRDASGCGGDYALKAPACGETVDVSDFEVRWTPLTSGDGKVSVVVERVDQPATYRGTAQASQGRFAQDALLDFLKRLQGRNDAVDITVTVMGNGQRSVRMVHIPPSVRTELYQARISGAKVADRFLKTLELMALAMEEGMWSKAAVEARRIMELAQGSVELQQYALAGLCQSDFEEEKVELRRLLPKSTYEGICSLSTSTATVTVAASQSAPALVSAKAATPAAAVSRKEAGKTRLGVALLIGNSQYWNQPLSSVRSDLDGMKESLEAIGFQVAIRENLRDPKQFQDALAEFLKKENAGPEDVLLVYYSGHGLQIDGKAHLLGTGVSATAHVVDDVRANAQSAEEFLADMERAAPGTRIFIVEACRNNPFASPSALGGQALRGGFAFQQDDVPNTYIMFANKPGLPTPVRSEFGLMGPFTESLVYALNSSSGEIQEVFALAEKKTSEISPGQAPVVYKSKKTDRLILRPQSRKQQDNRAAELLNSAEQLYQLRDWEQFLGTVERARLLALTPAVQQRAGREVDWVRLVISAEDSEKRHMWTEAAVGWKKASELFLARQWVTMRAATAWLMADHLEDAMNTFERIGESDGQFSLQASQISDELGKAFPEVQTKSADRVVDSKKNYGKEFEIVEVKE